MRQPELTVIIPCYNCEKTLEAAFESCYAQGLDSFEIVMVDDGSTDGTRRLMEKLSRSRENAVAVFHEKNRGGGAARNTAVERAKADVIFCLDSDDLLPPGTLARMLALMKEKRAVGQECDGVGIHRSIKFIGDDAKKVSHINEFGYLGMPIPVESLFEKETGPFCPLYSTFMFTKKAFAIARGYPTDHGFDTQGFAWRFLTNGLIAYTCPGAEYLHRIHFARSYYVREYESGRVNYNWFKVLAEASHLFSARAKELLFGFSIQSDGNLFDILKNEDRAFDPAKKAFIRPEGAELYAESLRAKADLGAYDAYWMGIYESRRGRYAEALTCFDSAKKDANLTAHVERAMIEMRGERDGKTIGEIMAEIQEATPFEKRGSLLPLPLRAFRKAKKVLKKSISSHPFLYRPLWHAFVGAQNIKSYFKEASEYKKYRADIAAAIASKKVILDIPFGGLGDWLAFTSLPHLLEERHGAGFWLAAESLERVRHPDIFKLCFELNPHFKGVAPRNAPGVIRYRPFEGDKSLWNLISDCGGISVTENVEKQFGLSGSAKDATGRGRPEIYYRPQTKAVFADAILVDKNYISGKKLGWLYSDAAFDREISKWRDAGADQAAKVISIEPSAQGLFDYIDMIHSSKRFITVLSGGAALAAAMDKPFTVILPHNAWGGAVDQFIFRRSPGIYTR